MTPPRPKRDRRKRRNQTARFAVGLLLRLGLVDIAVEVRGRRKGLLKRILKAVDPGSGIHRRPIDDD